MEYEEELMEDIYTAMLWKETLAYNLIDYLLRDRGRLEQMVMDVREELNDACLDLGFEGDPPYPMTAQDICDRTTDDFPAMERYKELYGDYAYADE